MTYLDGGKGSNLSIPPAQIYIDNKYKQHKLQDEISLARIKRIITKYSFNNEDSDEIKIYGFASFINHSDQPNLKRMSVKPCFNAWFANRDIKKGEQIFIDYCEGAKDLKLRKEKLKEIWGIC